MFEIDTNGAVVTGNITIDLKSANTSAAILQAILDAINKVTGSPVVATGWVYTVAGVDQIRVSVVNANAAGAVPTLAATAADVAVAVIAGGTLSNPANIPINFTETDTAAVFDQEILTAINGSNLANIRAGYAVRADGSSRFTFVGATNTSDFSKITSWTVTKDVDNGGIKINFTAADTNQTLANAIAAAINAADDATFTVTATVSTKYDPTVGTTGAATYIVTLTNDGLALSLPAPFVVTGFGPGGNITGMAYLNGTMYAVSDVGGLFTLNGLDYGRLDSVAGDYGLRPFPLNNADQNYKGPPTIITTGGGPKLNYVATSADLIGITLEGLTVGPAHIYDPLTQTYKYQNVLFAVDSTGKLHTFDTTGQLLPDLIDGNTSVQMTGSGGTALATVRGVAFTSADYNLWHTTTNRTGDAGHGISTAPDLSRVGTAFPVAGGSSMYFGLEDPGAELRRGRQWPPAGRRPTVSHRPSGTTATRTRPSTAPTTCPAAPTAPWKARRPSVWPVIRSRTSRR